MRGALMKSDFGAAISFPWRLLMAAPLQNRGAVPTRRTASAADVIFIAFLTKAAPMDIPG